MKLPHQLWRALAGLGLGLATGCSQSDVVAELRSLSGSEDAVFLCRDGAGNGHPYTDCPDRDANDDEEPKNKLSVFALVSQTVTDEVAVVDVTGGHVVDVDPSLPGYGFLRVGGRPVSLATTPGGAASFVATADVGRNGLFALPTTCLGPPPEGRRELTDWPACRLDETPGEMTVLVEKTPGTADAGCALYDPSSETPMPSAAGGCWADLAKEGGAEGRRKLVVAFPDSGKLRVYDAQALLDAPPGYFPDCQAERELELKVDVVQGVAQTLPADLRPAEGEAMCSEVSAPTAPPPGKRGPRPAGFAVSDDNRLYIADQAAPVIHVLDTSSACNLTELPPLLPMSLREPERVVVTRRVAVSPLTPAGQRFVYAVDAEDQPGASVMAFDVSPGSTNATPLVRSGSPELPGEKPDRLSLGASTAKDVTFAYRDIPYVDNQTGVAQFGIRCDPDPGLGSVETPATRARPNADYTDGARPGLLRGLFGFILMGDGSIVVVDVDDFDAACRRPIGANASAVPDFRGCSNDPISSFFTEGETEDGPRLVTDEVSCRVVEPHRVRSLRLAINDSQVGINAPSLRSFPQLQLPSSAVSSASEDRARLLAVPFADASGAPVPAEVFVGSTRYSTLAGTGDEVPTDPNDSSTEQLASLNSVILPPLEPRSYAASDTVRLTYEGSFVGDRQSGFFNRAGVFTDPSQSFCASGVYDVATMTDYAARELGLNDTDAAAFGKNHADYVQLTTPFIDETDSYWRSRPPRDDGRAPLTRDECVELFGADDAEALLPARDLSIVRATATALTVEPRGASTATLEDIHDCFPTAQKYRLRAGRHWILTHDSRGFRHDVVESGVERACVRSCNPLKKWDKGRVFEISSDNDKCRAQAAPGEEAAADPLQLRVGCAGEDVACVFDQTQDRGVQIGGRASQCIFNGLNDRFALYRGRTPSVRDEAFTWQTTGGFTPLVMSLASISTQVSPQSIQFLQQAEQLAVVDGSSQGLSLFSLDTFAVVKPSPFY